VLGIGITYEAARPWPGGVTGGEKYEKKTVQSDDGRVVREGRRRLRSIFEGGREMGCGRWQEVGWRWLRAASASCAGRVAFRRCLLSARREGGLGHVRFCVGAVRGGKKKTHLTGGWEKFRGIGIQNVVEGVGRGAHQRLVGKGEGFDRGWPVLLKKTNCGVADTVSMCSTSAGQPGRWKALEWRQVVQ